MKAKKKTMLIAAFAVAIVALAGVGYAAVYTATTTNTANSLTSTYIVLTQTGGDTYATDWLSTIYYDTVNTTSSSNTEYTPVWSGGKYFNTNVINTTEGDVRVTSIVNNALSINVKSTDAVSGRTLTIASDTALPAGLTYYLSYKIGDGASAAKTLSLDGDGKVSDSITGISVTAGGNTVISELAIYVSADASSTTEPSAAINGITFTFTMSAGE